MGKKHHKNKSKKASRSKVKLGKAPGVINYVGERKEQQTSITLYMYTEVEFSEVKIEKNRITESLNGQSIKLVNVVGIADEATIENIGKDLNLNSLLLEDLTDTLHRPKIDEYEEYIFAVLKMLYLDENDDLVIEHVALTLLENAVFIFQETEEHVFDGVLQRIKNKSGLIRTRGADYLFFALIDAIIDHYYVVLEDLKAKLEDLENEVYEAPLKETAQKIQAIKKDILRVRKWVFPVKELINRLIITEHPFIQKATKLYLKDAYDHCTEINEDLGLYREMAISMMEIYMTHMSNKMNEVMKVLTVMASIFIPLTFIAGIYGMNFANMPELSSQYGYPIVWVVFIITGIGLLIFFRKRGWL
ncbi:MAG: magnesium/cobalt transporter CorA [Croceitalea sp.]|nr:magnesium/cobalt transporter CorA [Croceitalea sp.]